MSNPGLIAKHPPARGPVTLLQLPTSSLSFPMLALVYFFLLLYVCKSS